MRRINLYASFLNEEFNSSLNYNFSTIGAKAQKLKELQSINLPIPNSIFISGSTTKQIQFIDIEAYIAMMEAREGKVFGKASNPLLLAVRSSSFASMPGILKSIINIGINDEIASGLISTTGNKRFVFDLYCRFIRSFYDNIEDKVTQELDRIIQFKLQSKKVSNYYELDESDLYEILSSFKTIVKVPQKVQKQLEIALNSVISSFNSSKVDAYRKYKNLKKDEHFGIIIQRMVFGNVDNNSGSGVTYTRNPFDDTKELFGEYIIKSQGVDISSGIATPDDISSLKKKPDIYDQLLRISSFISHKFEACQEIEFTIESGRIFILQVRDCLSKNQTIINTNTTTINKTTGPVAIGIAASPGYVSGKIVFNAEDAVKYSYQKQPVILVREFTNTNDIQGIFASKGLLTAIGGKTSHAAVIARANNICCITGCKGIKINDEKNYMIIKGQKINKLDYIILNGVTGEVFLTKET